MRYQYVVILKKDSERTTDLLSILLCFLSAASFLFIAVSSIQTEHFKGYFISAAAIILLAGLLFNFVSTRRNRDVQVRYRYLLIIAAIGWIGMTSVPWIGLFFFVLAFLEYQTKRPLEIGFDQDRVVINGMIKEYHSWREFNNIVLKDGLLTLDFTNNRLLQKEVMEDDDEDNAEEEEFNEYCRIRLEGVGPKDNH